MKNSVDEEDKATMATVKRKWSENVTKRFGNIFLIIPNHYAFEMCPSSPSIDVSGVEI